MIKRKMTGLVLIVGLLLARAVSAQNIDLSIESSQDRKVPSNPVFNQANIDAFEAKYPNIKVKILLMPDAQQVQTIQTKLITGVPSDLVLYNKVSAENELSLTKNFLDLSAEPWVARIKQPEMLKTNGKVYSFTRAIDVGGAGLVYNKTIFANLKLKIPTTWSEFVKVCDVLKQNNITPLYGPFKDIWTFQIWPTSIWGILGAKDKPTLYDDLNSGKLKWANVPEFVDTLTKANQMFTGGYFQKTMLSDDYNGAPAAMSSGKYAMMIMGDWFVADMLGKDPSLKLDLFPIPGSENPAKNLLVQSQLGNVLLIPNKAKHIKEAKLFLDFLSQPEQVARDLAVESMAYLPNLKDVPGPAKMRVISETLYNNYIKTGMVTTELNAFVKVDLGDLWRYYQDLMAGQKTPKEVLAAWDKKFAELMKAKGLPGF